MALLFSGRNSTSPRMDILSERLPVMSKSREPIWNVFVSPLTRLAEYPASPNRCSSSRLAGQQVSAVRRQLQQLGLVVRVLWQPSDQDPGTVLSVQPNGRVPVGSVIVITAVSQQHHGGQGHGHGDGQGNGNGGGGD